MKKYLIVILTVLLTGMLFVTGCNKKDVPDTTPVEKEEQTSDKETPAETDKADEESEVVKVNEEFEAFVPNDNQEGYTNVNSTKFKYYFDTFNEENAIIIDASSVFVKGHLPGAVNISVNDIEKLKELDKEKNVLLYASTDKEALYVITKLNEEGFKSIFRLEGNFAAWEEREFPIEKELTQGKINDAKQIIANLPDGPEKEALKAKLANLQTVVDLEEPVKTVEKLADELNIEGAATQDQINKANDLYNTTKELVLAKVVDIQDSKLIKRLEIAKAKIIKAETAKIELEAMKAVEQIKTEADALNAEIFVANVENEKLRMELEEVIKDSLQTIKKADKEEVSPIDAAVLLAEKLNLDGTDTQEEINNVQRAHDVGVKILAKSEDPENLKKIENAKLVKIQNLVDKAQKALEVQKAKDLIADLEQ